MRSKTGETFVNHRNGGLTSNVVAFSRHSEDLFSPFVMPTCFFFRREFRISFDAGDEKRDRDDLRSFLCTKLAAISRAYRMKSR